MIIWTEIKSREDNIENERNKKKDEDVVWYFCVAAQGVSA